MTKQYHCCATCINYDSKARKCTKDGRNWNTSPKFVFDCWVPNNVVAKILKKEGDPHE